MKKSKLINLIISIIMFILTSIFALYIVKTDILPNKYLILLIVGLVVFLTVIGLFLLKFKKKVFKIIGYILSFILIAIMAVVIHFLRSTMDFIGGIDNIKYKEENFVVLVLNDSKYQNITELNDKKIDYVPSELNNIDKALDELSLTIKFEKVERDNYLSAYDSLFNETVDAILIEESQKELIDENNDVKEKVRVIHKITIKTELTDVDEVKDVIREPFAVYLTGIDTYGTITSVSRSDVNIVAIVNPNSKQVLLVSVPRDYYVQINGTTGLKDKLTHAGIYGIDTSMKTIEDLLEVDINYYFKVNFSSVIKIVDTLGGIDVYSQYTFTTSRKNDGDYTFYKGYNHMNGHQTLAFVRERYNMPGGDRNRGINQQAVISGLIDKATSSAIITKYNKLLKELSGTFQTNMSENDITSLIKMQLNDMAKWTVTSVNLDGSDGSDYTYSYPGQKLYVMRPNEETVSKAIQMINDVEEGKKLESSYEEVTDVKNPTDYIRPPYIPSKPKAKPTITLVGPSEVVMLANTEYVEQGVTIKVDASDKKTKLEDVKIDGTVDITIAGEYILTYSITDTYKKTAKVTRKVIVLDPLLDTDGDTYTNGEEVSAGTNPLDNSNYPGSETETPGTETPGTETPGTETPGTETPGTETPGTETPGTETPGTETPGTETPGTETPGTETPETETPNEPQTEIQE